MKLHQSIALLLTTLFLTAACSEPKPSLVDETQAVGDLAKNTTVQASNLPLVKFSGETRTNGQTIGQQVVQNQLLNATGGFTYPEVNAQFNGNVTVSVEASDAQGIAQIYLTLGGTSQAYQICDVNCGAEFGATISGINPALLGGINGQNVLELWVEDNEQNLQLVSSLSINWQPKIIGSVIASIDPASSELSLSWSTDDSFLWYNVYVATEPHVSSATIEQLAGSSSALGIRTQSTTIASKPVSEDYYLVVVGVDGTGESAISKEITLVGGLDFTPPTAVNDVFSLDEDQTLAGNLLLNDVTTGTNVLTINPVAIAPPSHGTVELQNSGAFTYQPEANFNGNDQFSYEVISTNGLRAIALVTVQVNAVNDPPVANDDSLLMESSSLTLEAPGLLSNDFDLDGDTMTVSQTATTAPLFGTLNLESSGGLSYVPGEGFTTFDEFSYQVNDGAGGQATATVTIVTPDFNGFPPFALSDSYSVNEDALLQVDVQAGILANDQDRDNDLADLTLSVTQQPSSGTLVLLDDGAFSYEPAPNFHGEDHFTYQLSDPQGNTTVALVTIDVAAQNDPPVANDDQYTVANVLASTIPNGLGILTNDGDIDSDNLMIDLASVVQPTTGTVAVNSNGSFVYNPVADFVGTVSFSYRLTDGNLFSNTATVQLHVVNAHGTTDDETPVSFDLQAALGERAVDAVVTGVSTTLGTVSMSDQFIIFSPQQGLAGNAVISVELEINGQVNTLQFVIQVQTDNSVPEIQSGNTATIAENSDNGTSVLQVIASDPDGDSIHYQLTDPSGGFTINPTSGEITVLDQAVLDHEMHQSLSVTVSVFDEFDAVKSQAITISIQDMDEAPELTSAAEFEVIENTGQGQLIYKVTGSDPEGGTVFYSLGTNMTMFNIDANGNVFVATSGVFDFEMSSQAVLDVILSDGQLQHEYQVNIRVLDDNEAPSITSPSTFALDENLANGSQVGYTATIAPDPEGHNISWSLTSDPLAIFAIDANSGLVTIADNTNLDFEQTNSYQVSITATETNGSPTNLASTLNVTVTINDVEEGIDSDEDGLTDDLEAQYGTNINDPDSDDDGLLDGQEVELGTDPLDEDSDDDLVTDGDEVAADTDPLSNDRQAPTVASVSPADLSTGICTNTGIEILFSEAMRADTLNNTNIQLSVTGGSLVTGTVEPQLNARGAFFRPDATLTASTSFDVSVAGVKDSAGNVLATTFTSTFNTGTCLESDPPNVINFSPWANADNVPLNATVTIEFDEAINDATVNSESFVVQNNQTGAQVAGQISISDDKRRIHFVPTNLLAASNFYHVSASSIEDIYGNVNINFGINFKTGFEADLEPLEIESVSIEEGQLDFPLNGYLAILFDAPLNKVHLADLSLFDDSGSQVNGALTLDSEYRRLMFKPESNLSANTNYHFFVSSAQDLAGNVLAETINVNFTTGSVTDDEAGQLSLWSLPSNNVQNVPSNGQFAVTFTEPVDPTTLFDSNFYLYNNSTGEVLSASLQLNDEKTTFELQPHDLLQNDHLYYLYLGHETPITDLAGNEIAKNASRYFRAGDSALTGNIVIDDTNFPNGSLIMPVNSELQFGFDRIISEICSPSAAVTLSDDSGEIAITVALNSNRDAIEVTSVENLDPMTSYQLTIDGLCDYAGNILASTTYTFTTSMNTSADVTAPTLVTITPAHQATDVAKNTNIVMEFDEDIALTAQPKVLLEVTGTDIEVPGTYDINGNVLTFIPDEPLIGSNRYRIELYSTIADMAGNTRNNSTRYFDTVSETDDIAPTVVSITPSNGALNVNGDMTDVVITFSEPLAGSTVNNDNFLFYVNGSLESPSVSRSANGRVVTLADDFADDAVVSVIVTSNVTDLANNPVSHYVSTFVTAPQSFAGQRASLITQSPFYGATDVTERHNVYYYFDKPIDPSTLDGNLRVVQNGSEVAVTLDVIGNGQTVHAYYADGFEAGASVYSYLTDAIRDTDGRRIYADESYFELEHFDGADGVRPYVTLYSPSEYRFDMPQNLRFMVRFSEAMDESTFTTETVKLLTVNSEFSSDWTLSEVTFSFDQSGKQLTVVPNELLALDQSYYLVIESDVRDTDGDHLNFDFYLSATTNQDSIVDNRSPILIDMSPASGLEGVGINPSFNVKYDEAINEVSFIRDGIADVHFNDDNQTVRYRYYQPLTPDATHTETISGVADIAGNVIADASTTFTTQSGPDFESPTLFDVTFEHGDYSPINPVFTYAFSEPINPISVFSGGVYISDGVTGERIPAEVELSQGGKKLTVTPTQELAARRDHYVYITNLYDLSHNSLGYSYARVEVGEETEVDALQIVSTTVADNATEVPRNVRLNIRFNRAVSAELEPQISLVDPQGVAVKTINYVSRNRTLVSVVPAQLLAENTQYRWQVSDIKDISGNEMEQALDLSFTTSAVTDVGANGVQSWSFASNNVKDVPLNPLLQVTFDEMIDPTTIDQDSFYLADNGTGLDVPASWQLSDDQKTLTLVPEQALRENIRHYLYVSYSPYLTDLAGNRLGSGAYRYFDTGVDNDETAPMVLAANFTNQSTIVPLNAEFVLYFDEPLSNGCDLVSGMSLSDGTNELDISAAISTDRQTVTVSSNSVLQSLSTYTLSVEQLCDYAGNLNDTFQLEFTTTADTSEDNVAPSFVAMTPVHQATEVATTIGTITLEFDEEISLFAKAEITGGGITVPGEYQVNGRFLQFTPSIELTGNTVYTVALYQNVADLAGNTRNLGTKKFTTAARIDTTSPTVSNSVPIATATNVDPDADVMISFSEPILASSISAQTVAVYHDGEVINSSRSRSADGMSLTVSSNLPANAAIDVVLSGGITDLVGNPLTPQVISFNTGDDPSNTSRPSVLSQLPASTTTPNFDVQSIVFYLSRAIDPNSLEGNITVVENGKLIDVDANLSTSGLILTLTKPNGFVAGSRIEFYLEGITDSIGNVMYDHSGYIVVGDETADIGQLPYLTSTYPLYGAVINQLNPQITLKYNEPLDGSTVNTDNVNLVNTSLGNAPVDVTVSLDQSLQTITVIPENLLTAESNYQLQLSSDIKDTDGDNIYNNYNLYFSTSADAFNDNVAPSILAMSPPDGSTEVGVNVQYSVRFDEAINPLSFEANNSDLAAAFYSEDNQVVTYQVKRPLTPNSEVTKILSGVVDEAGNQITATSTTFNVGAGHDFTNPSVVDVPLTNNQQGVATNPVIKWSLSEPIDPVSSANANIYFHNSEEGNLATTWSLSDDGMRLTMSPNVALTPDIRYYAYVIGLRDLSGNALGTQYRYFTTSSEVDTTAPTVASSNIQNGATSVPLNASLRIRFDEAMNIVEPSQVSLVDGLGSTVPINVELTRERTLLNISPKQLFIAGQSYTLTVNGLNDMSGNSLDTAVNLSFTTSNDVDLSTSAVATWSIPVNGTVDVPLNPFLQITFDEAIDITTIDGDTFYLQNNATGDIVPSSWTLSTDGKTLALNPEAVLAADTRHYLYVGYSPYLTDIADNRLGQSSNRWFTTSDSLDSASPTLLTTSIANDSDQMPVNGQVVLAFNEPLSDGCLVQEAISLSDSGGTVSADIELQTDRSLVIVTPSALLTPSTVYSVNMAQVCDYAGNTTSGTTVSFSTSELALEDTNGPTLVNITPANGATEVSVDSTIVIKYDEHVDLRSMPPVKAGTVEVAGQYEVTGDTITFTPDEPLEFATTYTISLLRNVPDFAGNTQYGGNLTFTTAGEP